jgi:6-pyruvoyltetrahydropterin/6-carboxytetrahydropterin synthase
VGTEEARLLGFAIASRHNCQMHFQISVEQIFCAAHQLRLSDATCEPLHGHNWQLRVTVTADKLDEIGTVMDFHELQRRIAEIIRPMDNTNLNEFPPMKSMNPSAENVARYIAQSLKLPANVRLAEVSVTESPGCVARYFP